MCVCMGLHVFIFLDFEAGRLGRVERLIGLAMEKPEQNLSSFAAQKWLHFRLVVRADGVRFFYPKKNIHMLLSSKMPEYTNDTNVCIL